jgi:hypothetical protein
MEDYNLIVTTDVEVDCRAKANRDTGTLVLLVDRPVQLMGGLAPTCSPLKPPWTLQGLS